jgi:hypothetical protein
MPDLISMQETTSNQKKKKKNIIILLQIPTLNNNTEVGPLILEASVEEC